MPVKLTNLLTKDQEYLDWLVRRCTACVFYDHVLLGAYHLMHRFADTKMSSVNPHNVPWNDYGQVTRDYPIRVK